MVRIVDERYYKLPTISWAEGKPTCVIAHETANNSDNGSYEGELNYMRNNWGNAFVHTFTGDVDTALFHDPAKGGAWGSGPSMHHYAIHCELCRSSNKDSFTKAYNNWIQTMVHYAKKYEIPIVLNKGNDKEGIITHQYVTEVYGGTSHQDPNAYLASYGVSINQLAKDIAKVAGGDTAVHLPESNDEEIELNVETSVVDYLNAKGIDSSYSNRAKLAKKYGVSGYKGTAAQNLELLDALRHKDVQEQATSNYDGDSIVAYLNSLDKDSSYSHRAELAEQYGINGYAGTAQQNLRLLNLLRQEGTKTSNYDGNSVVAYLKSVNEDSSYDHRAELAENYGIDGYKGSAKQNLRLLEFLRAGIKPDTSRNGRTLYLPASADKWNVYKLNVQPISKNADWALTPSAFGGLEYEVLTMPYPNVATIKTSRGKRNIYVAPSTGAEIK